MFRTPRDVVVRSLGVRAEVNHLAFEPAILDALRMAPAAGFDISFVGTVSLDHQRRIKRNCKLLQP
jgi:spore maturation protein CgeB